MPKPSMMVVCSTTIPLAGREIARRRTVGSGHASGILRQLTASGVLLARDQGRVNTYELASPQSLLTRRLKDLFAAEARRHQAVVERLLKGVNGVLSVVLFGSEARGEAKSGSDTDLLIVVERKTKRLENQLSDACLRLATEHQLALSWFVADPDQLREWQAEGSDFLRNVQAEGIRLAGKPLERLLR